MADTATSAATDVARSASSANGMAIRWWSRSRPSIMMPRSSEAHDVVGVRVANRSARGSEVADDWRDGGRFDDRVVLGQNLSEPRAEKLVLTFVEMRGMLQTGRCPLELAAHTFQRRRTVEYERHVSPDVIKQRPQWIVARERGTRDGGLGVGGVAHMARFLYFLQRDGAIVRQQRRMPHEQVIVEVVSIVAIDDVITGHDLFERAGIRRQRG